MTLADNRNHKINWTLDKILMGILVFLAVKSYNSIDEAVQQVQKLDTRTTLIEYRLTNIETKLKQ